ncbi:hypothetical protein [Micromonospora maris]|uniref:Uncharacterized protein n=1 Tax=Micromonospora maris TaxID=1003110 RepID=A0A9X0I743_9ACTN|nr:hypothetical protein [Micromonospora maris]AEB42641.1 hypothetical protein VAB18032_07605 [Micromonospora maris AB-18-032]KUJ48082.1 hypothetical protein ADL17_03085 [Micromonospora maris]
MTARTQEEIVTRIRALRAHRRDIFGFREEVLVEALDLDHARQLLGPGTPGGWTPRVDHETYARDYLRFAIGKIIDHRGNSASRSVDKLGELAWLLGRDDIVRAMDHTSYPMYGAPTVKAFADGFGWPFLDDLDSDDQRALARMADGQQCDPQGCQRGCAD